VILSLCW